MLTIRDSYSLWFQRNRLNTSFIGKILVYVCLKAWQYRRCRIDRVLFENLIMFNKESSNPEIQDIAFSYLQYLTTKYGKFINLEIYDYAIVVNYIDEVFFSSSKRDNLIRSAVMSNARIRQRIEMCLDQIDAYFSYNLPSPRPNGRMKLNYGARNETSITINAMLTGGKKEMIFKDIARQCKYEAQCITIYDVGRPYVNADFLSSLCVELFFTSFCHSITCVTDVGRDIILTEIQKKLSNLFNVPFGVLCVANGENDAKKFNLSLYYVI